MPLTSFRPAGEQARAQIILLLVAFLLGLAGGAFLFHRLTGQRAGDSVNSAPEGPLSESTLAVLRRLESPVSLRFYAVLDPASVAPSMNDFTGRVCQLLSEYQRASSNKVRVTLVSRAEDSQAAAADGIKAFNQDKGDACFLGITVAQGSAKESLAQLSLDWERALEFDVSRAIARVSSPKPSPRPVAAAIQNDPAVLEAVKRVIPNPTAMSLEEGKRALRQKALTDLATASQDMEAQVKAAEQRVAQARTDQSEAAQQAAVNELVQLRSAQTEKLKQVAAQLQAQLDAWEALKRK
jgi:hypothetical protein